MGGKRGKMAVQEQVERMEEEVSAGNRLGGACDL